MPATPLVTVYSRGRAPQEYSPNHMNLEFGAIERAMPSPLLREITASTTAQNDDGVILANATSGPITVTLGAVGTASGHPIIIKKTDASANAVTIGGTVDGVASRTLVTQDDSIVVQSSGTAWFRPILTASTGAASVTSLTFTTTLKSVTAFTTPSALAATQFTAFASTVSGATLMGYGTTGDVTLKNRAGTDALVVTANTVDVVLKGGVTAIGAFVGVTGAFTKATAGDVLSFTNGGGTPQTGRLYSGATYCGLMNGANASGYGILMTTATTELFANGARQAWASTNAFSFDATTLVAITRFGEDSLTWGNAAGGVRDGALAQVNGSAVGFNIMSPGSSTAPYYLLISGKDVSDGNSPTDAFIDEVVFQGQGTIVPVTKSSTTTIGAPGARTYSNNTGALKIAIASGATWYIDIRVIRFAY